ncbi:MAG: hypothetical protein O7A04_08825, partial [Acidobacteria bacterium]|nr:hypothetical protein [Acidobacteriota bacterium]
MTTVSPSRPPVPQPPSRARHPAPVPSSSARTVDPFRLLRRHLVLLVATGFTGVFLGVVVFILFKQFLPMYSGETLFEIRAGLDEARDIAGKDIARDDIVLRLATTETMLLTSREVLEAAVKQPDVQTTAWFKDHYYDKQMGPLIDAAVDELEEDVMRRLVPGTSLFGIRWSSKVASDVPIILTSIGRAYMDKRKRLDEEIYMENIEVFKNELAQTKRELDDLGQLIETFIREKGITTLDDPRSNQLSLAMQDLVERIAETNSAMTLTLSMYSQVEAKLEGTIEPSDDDRRLAQDHPAIRPHEMAVLQTKTSLRSLRAQYHDPDQYSIRKQDMVLRSMELEYEAKLQEIMRANLQAQFKALADQIERYAHMSTELEKEYEEKSTLLRALAADMSHYLELEEQRRHLGATRDADLELIKEVRLMRLRADASRVRLAQAARTPREVSFPKIELVVPATAVLVLGLVVGLIFLREFTDQRVKSASDLVVVPDARILGVIPELAEDPCRSDSAELVVSRTPQSVLAESYRQTSALIDKAMSRLGHQTLLVVGGLPGSGTTTVITNIAAASAAGGRSVVVVDANFRRPGLARAMGVDGEEPGLGDTLMGEFDVDKVIQSNEYGIDVVS